MSPEVSRVLARAKAELRLGAEAAAELATEYADTERVQDLPAWLRDFADDTGRDSEG